MIYFQNNSYNLDVAKLFGVMPAILLTCLDMEYQRAFRNNQLNANNTLAMSRAEIYARTGLDDEAQLNAETSLIECGVITSKPVQNVPNKNYYILNEEQLNKILVADNPEEILGYEKAHQFITAKRVEPMSKRQTTINALKKKIRLEDPVLQTYFIDWIDAVYTNPKGFLSNKAVEFAQQELLAYCGDNQEKQLAIMKIAIKGGLRDITWAIEQYEKKQGTSQRNFASYDDIKAQDIDTDGEVF